MAVLFILPGIAQPLPDSWRNPVTELWPAQAGSQLTSFHTAAHPLQPWPGFCVMCLFFAIVHAIADGPASVTELPATERVRQRSVSAIVAPL